MCEITARQCLQPQLTSVLTYGCYCSIFHFLTHFTTILLHGFCWQMSERWSYPPLNDTAEAALRVNLALAERGWCILT